MLYSGRYTEKICKKGISHRLPAFMGDAHVVGAATTAAAAPETAGLESLSHRAPATFTIAKPVLQLHAGRLNCSPHQGDRDEAESVLEEPPVVLVVRTLLLLPPPRRDLCKPSSASHHTSPYLRAEGRPLLHAQPAPHLSTAFQTRFRMDSTIHHHHHEHPPAR